MSSEERFWSRVQAGESDECWWWQGHRDKDGYGRLEFNGKSWRAHRLSWSLTFGEIPKGLCACHHCDEPSCVNPYHLFLGTNADNQADMTRKGRSNITKLTQSEVWEIRGLLARTGLTQRKIGRMFGVCKSTIGNIARNKNWGWLEAGDDQ